MPSPKLNPKLSHKWTFDAIGTTWSLETAAPLGDSKRAIVSKIDSFDKTYSRFRDDSLVTAIASRAGVYEFPDDAQVLMGYYEDLYAATDGAVSPLVGRTLEQAGYDKTYSLQASDTVSVAPAWTDAMRWTGQELITQLPVSLDFGAAGKGYLIDIVAEILNKNGHDTYVIDASGDIYVQGAEQVIGLENPYDAEQVIGSTVVTQGSLCASASNRRAWGEWHHVIDPRTAKPVVDIVATWTVASTAMVADGLATALFFVGPEKLSQWEFEYVRLLRDGTVERSANFVGELYI